MPQPQDNARFVLLVMFILWLNTSNEVTSGILSAPSLILEKVQRQRMSYYTMQNSHWGDFAPAQYTDAEETPDGVDKSTPDSDGKYLNITGFRKEDGLVWGDLGRFRQRCLEWSRNAYPFVDGVSLWDKGLTMLTWQNATGSVSGFWERSPASFPRYATSYNLTSLMSLDITRASGGRGHGINASDAAAAAQPRSVDNAQDDGPESSGKKAEEEKGRKQIIEKDAEGDKEKQDTQSSLFSPMHTMDWGRNVTGPSGKMIIRITDEDDELAFPEERFMSAGPPTGGLVRSATATVTIEDVEGTGSSYDMKLHGVHWPRQGTLLLTTTSDKFSGIFGLPHLTPDPEYFLSSQRLLKVTLDKALKERENARSFGPPDPALSTPLWSSTIDAIPDGLTPVPRCEYLMYLQIHPLDTSQFLPHKAPQTVSPARAAAGVAARDVYYDNSTTVGARALPEDFDYSQDDMTQLMLGIESELRFPTGAPIFHSGVPEIQVSAVLFSPDCGYFIETKGPPKFGPSEFQHLRGRKVEEFIYEARMWMIALAAVLFCQIQLFLGQARETSTPSTLGRISFLTMAAMVLADGLVLAIASTWSLTASASFLPSLTVTFAGFASTIAGGYFLSEVYGSHEPERRRREREHQQQAQQQQQNVRDRLREHFANTRAETAPILVPFDQDIDAEIAENESATAAAAATVATAAPLLPAPATATRPPAAAAAATTTASHSLPFSTVVARMSLIGVVLLFLSLAATTWWASVRAYYTNTIGFIYLSMWIPQILRNIERNSRRAFSWRFMVGQSGLRLMPLAYFYLRPDNILFAETDWASFAFLAAWVWVQLFVLAFQDALGPRYGIRKSWVSEAWDYHRVLREDDLEAGGLPIGLVPAATEDMPESPAGALPPGATSTTNIWTMDCPICCETLDVPLVRAGVVDPTEGGVAGVFARRQYMATPCRHIFHTKCLVGWLNKRLQCPICREEVPPL